MLEIFVLGRFEVRRDGAVVAIRPKQRALLAALALRGAPVPVDRLVDDLWGESPPASAVASLQNAVSLLRRALGDDALVTRGGCYELGPRTRVDVRDFERLVAEAQSARGEERAATLRRALALWRGPALDDLAFEPFAATEAPRLDELRMAALEQLGETELALGGHEAAVPGLEALVESAPFRERPRALLMLALYRCGRQAEALALFAATRRLLRDELGLEPSPALKSLQKAILRHDPALEPPETTPLARFVGEERRKTVTVLFCDLVGSTRLAEALDAEVFRSVLRRYYRLARSVLEEHGGAVEKFVGDAVVAVFGVPASREDDALRAVRGALDLRARLAGLNAELERELGVALSVRLGVSTGEAIAGEPDSGQSFATGYAVNVAAKLQQAAQPDTLLASAATYRLIRDAVEAEPAPQVAVGSAAAPLAAFRIDAVRAGVPGVARNLSAPLVGRRDELERLRARLEEAFAARECRVAVVLGEAGIGKSRLAVELLDEARAAATVLVGRCSSYGEGATYLPVADVVRAVAPDRSETAIAALLADEPDARLVARRIRELLGWEEGAPPPGEGAWAVRRLLAAVARARPLLLVLDDVHWAESALLDLVDVLADQAAAPIFVLCLARPDLLETRPAWEERVAIRLAPLTDEEAAALLDGLGAVPAATRARIVEVAEGNALFVEQLHAHALDAGDDVLERVPATLDALLASRLDRLPEAERAVLERAAVVGRVFSRAAVDELSEHDASRQLERLAARGLVRPTRAPAADGDSVAFHHALIRDVAYAGITKERRSRLHERVARWLAARGDGRDELVGYHLEHAYRLRRELGGVDEETSALGEEAAHRLASAGLRAWQQVDAHAAVNLLERALALPAHAEHNRGELLCELAQALRFVGRLDEADTRLGEAHELAAAAGDDAVELRARVDQLGIELFTRRHASCEEALSVALDAIPVLERLGADRAVGRAWLLAADVHNMRCRMAAWGEAAELALVHYRRAGWSPTVAAEGVAAAAAYGPEPVAAALDRCASLLAEHGDLATEAAVATWQAMLAAMQGEFEEAHERLDHADRLDAQLGRERTSARFVRGYAYRYAGQAVAAASEYDAAVRLAARQRRSAFASSHAADLATLLVDLGRHAEARRLRQTYHRAAHPEDAFAAFVWRLADAKLAAADGSTDLALELGADALRLAAATDAVAARAWVTLEVALIHAAAGSSRTAARLRREAASLFREKGHVAGLALVGPVRGEHAAARA